MLLQILLIPLKLVFRLLGLVLMGAVKVVALPFKIFSFVVGFLASIIGAAGVIIGISFVIGGFIGAISVDNWLVVGGFITICGCIIAAIPRVGMGIGNLLDMFAECIGDKFSEVSILTI